MPPPDDRSALEDIEHAARLIFEATADLELQGFLADWIIPAAVERQLGIIGEAVKRLTPEFRSEAPEADWKGWAGLRDVLVHAYDSLDYTSIWKTFGPNSPHSTRRSSAIYPG